MKNFKTLRDLAELVAEKEGEFAPGSETSLYGGFVASYDHVSSILFNGTSLDVNCDETEAYNLYQEAYRRMELFEAENIEYDNDMLWCGECTIETDEPVDSGPMPGM